MTGECADLAGERVQPHGRTADIRFMTGVITQRAGRVRAAVCVAAVLAAGAAAGAPQRTLARVDPNREDISPLRTSFRVLQPDLRAPSGFDQVYRVPGSTTGVRVPRGIERPQPDRFARVSGGLAAVFPASEYIQDRKGRVRTMIPAGTVFYIGGVPETAQEPVVRRRSPFAAQDMADTSTSNRVAMSAIEPLEGGQDAGAHGRPGDRRFEVARDDLRPTQRTEVRNVLTNERYRQARTRALLSAAAANR